MLGSTTREELVRNDLSLLAHIVACFSPQSCVCSAGKAHLTGWRPKWTHPPTPDHTQSNSQHHIAFLELVRRQKYQLQPSVCLAGNVTSGSHRAPQGTVSSLLMEGQRPRIACSLLAVAEPGMMSPLVSRCSTQVTRSTEKTAGDWFHEDKSWCTGETLVSTGWVLSARKGPEVPPHVHPEGWVCGTCSSQSPPPCFAGGCWEMWPPAGTGCHRSSSDHLGQQHLWEDSGAWGRSGTILDSPDWGGMLWVHPCAPVLGAWPLLVAISLFCWSQGPQHPGSAPLLADKLSPTSTEDVFLACCRQSPSYSSKSSAEQGLASLCKSKHHWWILVSRPNPAPGFLPHPPSACPSAWLSGFGRNAAPDIPVGSWSAAGDWGCLHPLLS